MATKQVRSTVGHPQVQPPLAGGAQSAAPAIIKTYHSSPSNKVRPINRTPSTSADDVLNSDYDFKNFLTLKAKTLVDAGQSVTVQGKGVLKLEDKKTPTGKSEPNFVADKKGSFLRFSTAVNRFGLEARVWGDGRFKLAIDAGHLIENPKNENLFALVRSNHQFSSWTVGLGLIHTLAGNGYALGRVKVDNKGAAHVDFRSLLNSGKWRFFENFGFNVSNNEVIRLNSWLGYYEKDFDVILAHESTSKKFELGRILGQVTYRYNKYKFAVQEKYENKHASFTVGGTFPLNDTTTLKAKIDDQLTLATAAKIKLNKKVTLGLSSQLKLSDEKLLDSTKTLPFPIGVTIDATL